MCNYDPKLHHLFDRNDLLIEICIVEGNYSRVLHRTCRKFMAKDCIVLRKRVGHVELPFEKLN